VGKGVGYPVNSLQFGYGAEGSIFDAIAHDPPGERRPDHRKRGEFIHPREVEINRRTGPR